MDRIQQQDQWLDDLLGNPAPLAEQGFDKALRLRLKHQARIRRRVFAGMALGWLALVLLLVPLDSVLVDIQQALVVGTWISELVRTLVAFDISRDALGAVSLLPFVIGLSAIFAVANLQLKR